MDLEGCPVQTVNPQGTEESWDHFEVEVAGGIEVQFGNIHLKFIS